MKRYPLHGIGAFGLVIWTTGNVRIPVPRQDETNGDYDLRYTEWEKKRGPSYKLYNYLTHRTHSTKGFLDRLEFVDRFVEGNV